MILNIEQMLIHNPFDSFSIFFLVFPTLQFSSSVFKLQLSWKHTKKNLPVLARYYFAVKVKNNERSSLYAQHLHLDWTCQTAFKQSVNARKTVTSRLQYLGKLQYIWLIWIWTCISQKLFFKFFERKSLQKEEVTVRYPTTLFLHLKMTQH